jgi:hypothetical protein
MFHLYSKSPLEILNYAAKATESNDVKVRVEAARMVLENEAVLNYVGDKMRNQGAFVSAAEINLISRTLDVQTRVTIEKIQKPKRPLFFYDLFRANGLIRPTEITSTIRALKIEDWSYSDVQFLSDMTDDLPTQAGKTDTIAGVRVEPIGNSVRVGLFELRDALRNGEDLIAKGIAQQFESILAFANEMIATGAPLKSMYGLLNNPTLSGNTFTVPVSAINPPFTQWAQKSQTEIIADLAFIKSKGFSESDQVRYPNQFLVAKAAYDVLTLTQMPNQSGQFVINAWNASQALDTTAEPMVVTPTLAFNGAASDGVSNMGLAGDFSADVLEMFFAAPEVLPTQNHGLHFHVPIVSAISGVNIRRPEYLTKWEGM